ncbi:MAG: acetylhydrolase [Verrucomicrobiae bacterium]|nr:acetylhydrolase [Verrucomicrobiae bacterium]
MKTLRHFLVGLLALVSPALTVPVCGQGADKAPSREVRTLLYDWKDATREGRVVPVKIYLPQDAPGPLPVILFSHGLGGSREGYEYLGRHWAQNGYVSVHVQHPGSDEGVWKDVPPLQRMRAMKQAVKDPENATNRPRDVSFVIDQLLLANRQAGPLKEKIDSKKIGMAGHSFGAWTTMALVGQVFTSLRGKDFSWPDSRIRAAIAMSTPPAKNNFQTAYGQIGRPLFHMTGTEDFSIVTDATPSDKRVAFDHISCKPQYLLTFNGGDHMVFSGRGRGGFGGGTGEKDAEFQEWIKKSSLAFWEAYLQGDTSAKKWMEESFAAELGAVGTFEIKR